MSIKRSYVKKKIDSSQYVNVDTGEPLSSEHDNISSINLINEDYVIIDSKNYFIITAEAIDYINEYFSSPEVGRIIKMTRMVKGCYNALFTRENIPHDNQTLMRELEYTRNIFASFMQKLHRKHIIGYLEVYNEDGVLVKHIVLNPTLARKGKRFHVKCTSIFVDLSKPVTKKNF